MPFEGGGNSTDSEDVGGPELRRVGGPILNSTRNSRTAGATRQLNAHSELIGGKELIGENTQESERDQVGEQIQQNDVLKNGSNNLEGKSLQLFEEAISAVEKYKNDKHKDNWEAKENTDKSVRTYCDKNTNQEIFTVKNDAATNGTVISIAKFSDEVKDCILSSIPDNQVFEINTGLGQLDALQKICMEGNGKVKLSPALFSQLPDNVKNGWAKDYENKPVPPKPLRAKY